MRFRRNPTLVPELRRSPAFTAEKLREAEIAKAHAESIAPRGSTGDYRKSIVVTEHEDGRVTFGSTDFAGHLVEWGSKNNPAYAVLRRAAKLAGLKLREQPK